MSGKEALPIAVSLTVRRSFTLALVALAGLLAVSEAAHAAAQVELGQRTTRALPGQQITVRATVAQAERCTLTAGTKRKTVALRGATKLRFRFRLARAARPGLHRVALACDGGADFYRLRVLKTRRRAGRALVAGSIQVALSGRPAGRSDDDEPPAEPVGPDSPEVTEKWEKDLRPFFAESRNGECTDWALDKRLDIVEHAERQNIANWINAGRPGPGYVTLHWSGGMWGENARAMGLPVDQVPAAGAIMSRPGSPGHVAYVEEVAADGSFRVTDMGYDGQPDKVGDYWMHPDTIQIYNLLFIH